jgi:hypothetical protein
MRNTQVPGPSAGCSCLEAWHAVRARRGATRGAAAARAAQQHSAQAERRCLWRDCRGCQGWWWDVPQVPTCTQATHPWPHPRSTHPVAAVLTHGIPPAPPPLTPPIASHVHDARTRTRTQSNFGVLSHAAATHPHLQWRGMLWGRMPAHTLTPAWRQASSSSCTGLHTRMRGRTNS